MLKFKSRAFVFALVAMVLIGMTPFRGQSGAATSDPTRPTDGRAALNKFVGRWSSQFRKASGQVINDGVLDISDTAEPSADEVSVVLPCVEGRLSATQCPIRTELKSRFRLAMVALLTTTGFLSD